MSLGEGDKHVLVSGGLHANEPVGVKACVAYHKYLVGNGISLNGAVTFILGNPQGYQRFLDGDESCIYIDHNMNRAFLEKLGGGYEFERVREIRKFLDKVGRFSGLLDLHAVTVGNFACAVYPFGFEDCLDLAVDVSPFGVHYLYTPEDAPGAFLGELRKYGAVGVAIECGNNLADDTLNIALDSITRFLVREGIASLDDLVPLTIKKPDQASQYLPLQKIKVTPGFKFVREFQSEDFLKRGEVYAKDDKGEISAPEDCYILMPSKDPQPPDAGFLVKRGKIISIT